MDYWHTTEASEGLKDTFMAHSCEYPVLWINPNDSMSELAELRESSGEQYQE
jgi:hypothetical protein